MAKGGSELNKVKHKPCLADTKGEPLVALFVAPGFREYGRLRMIDMSTFQEHGCTGIGSFTNQLIDASLDGLLPEELTIWPE